MKIDASFELTDGLITGNNLHLKLSFFDIDTDAVRELTRFIVSVIDETILEIPAHKPEECDHDA